MRDFIKRLECEFDDLLGDRGSFSKAQIKEAFLQACVFAILDKITTDSEKRKKVLILFQKKMLNHHIL
jgi:hypothetical protein